MAETIQSNIKQNTKDYQNFGYFLKGIDDTHQNLDQLDPYIPGVSRLWMYKVPHFMNVMYKQKTHNFKTLIETGYISVQGINDLTVAFEDFQGGFAGQKFATVSTVEDSTDTVTVQVYESSGSPVREYLDTWITGTRDPRSGIAHYHGAIAMGAVRYGEINHTCEFIFGTLDPTARDLEYSCMFAHGFPTTVPKGHLNYQSNERGKVQMDIPFRISKYESPAINQVTKWYLEASQIEYNYLKFNPNITKAMVQAQALNYDKKK